MRGEDQLSMPLRVRSSGSPPHARGRLLMRFLYFPRTGDHPRMRGEDERFSLHVQNDVGSPPHARGRLLAWNDHAKKVRITPACAGKTATLKPDHIPTVGSPPHARGRRWDLSLWRPGDGITPACAGKTARRRPRRNCRGDHPRMRGEDTTFFFAPYVLPWITPACAGKTPLPGGVPQRTGDHPRMRGEDMTCTLPGCLATGSPPHARGRRKKTMLTRQDFRITPACAGKTMSDGDFHTVTPDHPRMRGEDQKIPHRQPLAVGSPPHARGRRRRARRQRRRRGITPACAGKTKVYRALQQGNADHPRMRGEDHWTAIDNANIHGSPPHARGRQCLVIISEC